MNILKLIVVYIFCYNLFIDILIRKNKSICFIVKLSFFVVFYFFIFYCIKIDNNYI